MKFAFVFYAVGALCVLFGVNMLPSIAWGVYYGEHQAAITLLSAASITTVVGAVLVLALRGTYPRAGAREGFAVAALGWIVLAGFGALPFYMGGYIPSYIDSYFETMSGLTTTGASILTCYGGELATDIESLPRCILFWRSYTHWLGGMGIIVLSLALLPLLGVGGMQIYRAEVPGPTADKLVPRVRETTKLLWGLYVLLSALECLLLWLHPSMSLFDAMCHTFGTMATGGFSTHSASVGFFASAYVDIVIIVFMVLAGANFALHYAALHGRVNAYLRDPEFLFYGAVIVLSVLGVSAYVVPLFGLGPALRHAAFQVVSIITTTGYTTQDFTIWPCVTRLALLVLMFFGGCAGSTGGGIKNIRIFVLLKHAHVELRRLLHPQAVIPLRVGGRPVKESVVQSVLAFFVLYVGIFVLASLIMTAIISSAPEAIAPAASQTPVASDTMLVTAVSSVAATLNNIGPGLGHVGPGDPRAYSWIPSAGKIVLTVCMLIGRLEVFTVVFLFLPWFYR